MSADATSEDGRGSDSSALDALLDEVLKKDQSVLQAFEVMRAWAMTLDPVGVLPEQVDHGPKHITRVTKMVAQLVRFAIRRGNAHMADPAVVFLALAAGLLHDCGITCYEHGAQDLGGKSLTNLTLADRLRIRDAHALLSQKAIEAWIEKPPADLSARIQARPASSSVLLGPRSLLPCVALCSGKHKVEPQQYRELEKSLDKTLTRIGASVSSSQFIACLAFLQLADLADMTVERLPKAYRALEWPTAVRRDELNGRYDMLKRAYHVYYVKRTQLRENLTDGVIALDIEVSFPSKWQRRAYKDIRKAFEDEYRRRTVTGRGDGLQQAVKQHLKIDIGLIPRIGYAKDGRLMEPPTLFHYMYCAREIDARRSA